jgi:aspartate kinase
VSTQLVIKFGGTSVATPVRLRAAAARIRAHVDAGRRVVAVVSAAGHSTDRILDWVSRVGAPTSRSVTVPLDAGAARGREVDRALATGEDRSAALLAVALWRAGVAARSLRGTEAGVQVQGGFGAGRIAHVDTSVLEQLLDAGIVPVVSGFQGVRADGETLTLGRGGSDISAVAIAAALGATCDIVTDVQAVYDRDPNTDESARPFARLDHATLVRLTERGARVVHPLAARLAADRGVPLRVYHFRAPPGRTGTWIGAEPVATAARRGGAA